MFVQLLCVFLRRGILISGCVKVVCVCVCVCVSVCLCVCERERLEEGGKSH